MKTHKWSKIVERNESVLIVDYIIRGLPASNTKKVLGIDKGFEYYLILNRVVYSDSEEFNKEIPTYFNELIERYGYPYISKFTEKWVDIGEELIKIATRLSSEDNSNKTNKELLSDFKQFSEQNWKLSTALMIPIAIEKQLSNEINVLLDKRKLSEEKKKEYFSILVYPKKDGTSTKEIISFYLLIADVQKMLKGKEWNKENIGNLFSDEKITEKLERYLKDFGWIGTRWYIGNEWNKKDVIERIAKLSHNERYEEKALELKHQTEKNNKETIRIYNELNFSKEEIGLVETAKEYVFIRTYRTDMFNKAGFIARPFLRAIAERLGISFEQLIFLSSKEIMKGLEGKDIKKSISKINERQKAFGALLEDEDIFVFEGKEIENYRKKHEFIEAVIESFDELKGSIANAGKVKGIAKIVKSNKDLHKVHKGDILVAPMTTPDFVPAMEKAAAFVTDEGGITCHAAIVSRELGVPCIVGTRVATQVLRDGDLVEVDANKGIVKVIKR